MASMRRSSKEQSWHAGGNQPTQPFTKGNGTDILQNKSSEEGVKGYKRGKKEAENSRAVGVCMHQHHDDESS